MKLLKCPECDSEINNGDSKCNNCGFPINKIVKPAPVNGVEKTPNRIISKEWVKYHAFISLVLSLMIGFISQENDVIGITLISLISAAFYWLILFCAYAVIRGYRDKQVSRGWLRLHVIFSLAGGGLLILLQSVICFLLGDVNLNEEVFLSWFWWPIFYWLTVILFWAIKRFNNSILNNKTINIIVLLITLCAFLLMIPLSNLYYEYNGRKYMEFETYQIALFVESLFLFLLIILFSFVWIKNGFQEDENDNALQ